MTPPRAKREQTKVAHVCERCEDQIPEQRRECVNATKREQTKATATDTPQWWCVEIKGLYLGKCWATRDEITKAVGPYHTISGNNVNVWGRLPLGKMPMEFQA